MQGISSNASFTGLPTSGPQLIDSSWYASSTDDSPVGTPRSRQPSPSLPRAGSGSNLARVPAESFAALRPNEEEIAAFNKKIAAWEQDVHPGAIENRFGTAKQLRRAFLTQAVELIIYDNSLTSLPNCLCELKSLRTLQIEYVTFENLPVLPAGLTSLVILDTDIQGLPSLPSGLKSLVIAGNALDHLPALPAALTELSARMSNLTQVPKLPSSLDELWLDDNPIAELPPLPQSLKILSVTDTELYHLPVLPAGLETLWACGTPIESLPLLPKALKRLYVSHCPLLKISNLGEGLRLLNATECNLDTLPEFPSSLMYLDLDSNNLSELPQLPEGMRQLHIQSNPLRVLPSIPASLHNIDTSMEVVSATIGKLNDELAVLDKKFNPYLKSKQSEADKTTQDECIAQASTNHALGGFDQLPPPLIGEIAKNLEPGSTDSLCFSLANTQIKAIVQTSVERDKSIAQLRRQIKKLETSL